MRRLLWHFVRVYRADHIVASCYSRCCARIAHHTFAQLLDSSLFDIVYSCSHFVTPLSFRVRSTNRVALPASGRMLINLLPDFFSILDSTDRLAAYQRYFDNHRQILEPYWNNYVIDPDSPHFMDIARATVSATRGDLIAMLERTDVMSLARMTEQACRDMLAMDCDVDVVLMVGVGAANAGELVVNGRGIAFVCLEHFTGTINTQTDGLGLDPELIPLWLAHEIAHVVRYTSPTSRSDLRTIIANAGGYYSYWDTGREATLRELLINEGLAIHVSRAISPGHAAWEYFGYERRQFADVRQLESVMSRAVVGDLDHTGLGLRLRYLSGGMSDEARTVDRYVLPERAGYYLGARMCEPAINAEGLAWALRARAAEISSLGHSAAMTA
jgi:hypothetical protein